MSEEQFDDLAPKVLSGEARPEEAARLEQLLAGDSKLRAQFAELEALWTALKETLPIEQAMDVSPTPPPPERVKKWQMAVEQMSKASQKASAGQGQTTAGETGLAIFWSWVRQRTGISPVALAAAGVVVVVLAISLLVTRRNAPRAEKLAAYLVLGRGTAEVGHPPKPISSPSVTPLRDDDAIRLPATTSATVVTPGGAVPLQGPQTWRVASLLANTPSFTNVAQIAPSLVKLRTALFETFPRLSGLLVTMRSAQSIAVYSPVGATANLTPAILWKAEPGKSYHITIRDLSEAAATPLRATNVLSPLQFSAVWPGRALGKDRLYRLQITETGTPLSVSELTFRTLEREDSKAPPGPADKLLTAWQILSTDPSRIGDP